MAAARITTHDINRLRAAADENATLADCWGKESVALVALEWAPQGFRYSWTSYISCNEVRGGWRIDSQMPVLTAEVVTFPNRPSGKKNARNPSFDRYRLWVQGNHTGPSIGPRGRQPPTEWKDKNGAAGELLQAGVNEIRRRLAKLFSELQQRHTAVCVCSHRPQQTKQGLDEIAFSLPNHIPFVDLISVLEYQSNFAVIPKQLSDHFPRWIEPDAQNGSFDEAFKAPDGLEQYEFIEDAPKWGGDGERIDRVRRPGDISVSIVLETLGPQAETHRRDINRLERENVALDRISKRVGKGKQHGAKRGPRKGPRDLTGEFDDLFSE